MPSHGRPSLRTVDRWPRTSVDRSSKRHGPAERSVRPSGRGRNVVERRRDVDVLGEDGEVPRLRRGKRRGEKGMGHGQSGWMEDGVARGFWSVCFRGFRCLGCANRDETVENGDLLRIFFGLPLRVANNWSWPLACERKGNCSQPGMHWFLGTLKLVSLMLVDWGPRLEQRKP